MNQVFTVCSVVTASCGPSSIYQIKSKVLLYGTACKTPEFIVVHASQGLNKPGAHCHGSKKVCVVADVSLTVTK